MNIRILIFLMGSYLVGSIPTGYWLGKYWRGIDIRQHGSGNLGATNVFRVLGTPAGIVTLGFDILKGFAPVALCRHFFPNHMGPAVAAGIAAILGHTTSIFIRFRGGKGVATSAGVFVALLPVPSAIALGAFGASLLVTGIVSLSSIVAAVALTLAAFLLAPTPLLAYTAAAVTCLVIWTHRGNIRRLLQGTESHVPWLKKSLL